MSKFCRECGKEIKDGAKFCASCGAEVKATSPETTNTASVKPEAVAASATPNTQTGKSVATIKCGNCGYEGPGEPARTIAGQILAWLCICFAPLITIIYFVATHKYRCPNCKSTFLGIKNEKGTFVGQNGAGRPILIFVYVLVGIAIIGILSSVVLASLNTARQKATEAQQQSQSQNY